MKAKIILAIILLLFISTKGYSQKYQKVSLKEKNEIIKSIKAISDNQKSMVCDFVQEKSISLLNDSFISNGRLYYKFPNKLKWSYVKPYVYDFIINSDKVFMHTENSNQTFDINSNQLFKEISKMMISNIDGSFVKNNEMFEISFYKNKNEWLLILNPKTKSMQQFFKKIKVVFNKANAEIKHITLVEKTGDSTNILLKNKKINIDINEEIFNIKK